MAGEDFFRTHRAYLVHFKYVEKYDATCVTMKNGTALKMCIRDRSRLEYERIKADIEQESGRYDDYSEWDISDVKESVGIDLSLIHILTQHRRLAHLW